MKRLVSIVLAAAMMAGMGAANTSAENSIQEGAAGISVDVNDDFVISGRYFVMDDLAVLALFGVGQKGGDARGTDVGVGIGAHRSAKIPQG